MLRIAFPSRPYKMTFLLVGTTHASSETMIFIHSTLLYVAAHTCRLSRHTTCQFPHFLHRTFDVELVFIYNRK